MFFFKCDKVIYDIGERRRKMKSCEATGKNIEQAIQNALLELKASREDVDIKILSEGGFLKKAKVLVSISEDALDKYERKEQLKQTLEEENDEDFAEKFVKAKIEKSKPIQKSEKESEKSEEKVEKIEIAEEVEPKENLSKKEEKNGEKIQRKFTAEEFINGILNALNTEASIVKTEEDRVVKYCITGENLNDLIGHHGDCLLALSHIMSLVCKNENGKRVILDVENYREKRQESLVALAKRIADKVAKSGRYYKLEPMEASERRIIHLALQDDDRVTTLSKGEEPRRHLIVFPKEYRD